MTYLVGRLGLKLCPFLAYSASGSESQLNRYRAKPAFKFIYYAHFYQCVIPICAFFTTLRSKSHSNSKARLIERPPSYHNASAKGVSGRFSATLDFFRGNDDQK